METDQRGRGGFFFLGLLLGITLTAAIASIGALHFLRSIKNSETPRVISTDVKIEEMKQKIHEHYYREVSDEELEDAMLHGMMDALNDPYSEYFTKAEWDSVIESMSGSYFGIGSYVMKDADTGYILLSEVMKGTPAERSGLKTGDLVTKADGTDLADMNLDNAVALIKGPRDTKVVLTVLRDGTTFEVEVTRDKIEIVTAEFEMLEDDIAYIAIYSFDDNTAKQFKTALDEAYDAGMKGLIVDVRGNGGGYLAVVVDMLKQILPKGLIVYTVDKDGNRKEYSCDGKNKLSVPMVLLVDYYSASASEIFAGAVRDYNLGTLIGTTTYGKGVVQVFYPLGDGTYAKLTNSAYYTPSGQCIQDIGITPDIELEFDGELYLEQGIDNQFERALEEIHKLIQ